MISVKGLERRFRAVTAVQDLNLDVPAGQVYGLLGPNGAGKTTTVRMLAALIAPTAGSATIEGLTLGPDNAAIRAMSGILTESPGLHDRLTARQNLAYYGRLYGLTGGLLREAVDRHLDVVGMAEAAEGANIDHEKEMVSLGKGLKCHRCDRNLTTNRAFL